MKMRQLWMMLLMGLFALVATAPEADAQQTRQERRQERKERRARERAQWESDMQEGKARARERQKTDRLTDSLAGASAGDALQHKAFVLEAANVSFKNGPVSFVDAHTNFISVNGDRAVVQVASSFMPAGQNGIGGITLDGSVSGFKIKETKKGKLICTFDVTGTGIHAQVSIQLPKGTDKATATINSNFNSYTVNLSGKIVPFNESQVYEGRSL